MGSLILTMAINILLRLPAYVDYTQFEGIYEMVIRNDEAAVIVSADEIQLMARVVMSEAGNQSPECKEAVATVILNRWMSPNYPMRLEDVIYAPCQFSTAYNGEPTEACYAAVYSALVWFGSDNAIVPKSCYYFRSGHFHTWALDYQQIDDLYFSLSKEAGL